MVDFVFKKTQVTSNKWIYIRIIIIELFYHLFLFIFYYDYYWDFLNLEIRKLGGI